jgi:transcriptional regulator of arginine metabolism
MNRSSRMILIEKLVTENVISSQEQLLKLMEGEGMKCTQATLSRDLRLMGISRGFDRAGNMRYLTPGRREADSVLAPGREQDAILSMLWSRGLLLLRTHPGYAAAVASRIDRSGRFEIAGTVAGDDTILLIPRDEVSNLAVSDCLETIFPGLMEKMMR